MTLQQLALATLASLGFSAVPALNFSGARQDVVRQELTKLDKRYKKAKEPAERIAVLKEAAELRTLGPDAPSPRVAEFLAAGLEDETLLVRTSALQFLVQGQEPEATVKALLAGWKSAWKGWLAIDRGLGAANRDRAGGRNQSGDGSEFAMWLGGAHYINLYIAHLGLVPDERVEAVLIELLAKGPNELPASFVGMACTAAGGMDTAAAVEARIACIARLERALDDGKVAVRYPRSGPNTLLDAALMQYREPNRDDLDGMLDALQRAAIDKQRMPAPPPGSGQAKAWSEWLEAHRASFTPPLGRLSKPLELAVELPKSEEQD